MAETTDTAPLPKTRRKASKTAEAAKTKSAKAPTKKPAAKPASHGAELAKTRFSKAMAEALAGVQALRDEAFDRSEAYREKLTGKGGEFASQAKAQAKTLSEQTRQKAAAYAQEGKTRTSDALAGLGTLVAENAAMLDEKLGVQFGDYARATARQLQDTASWIEAKDLSEFGEDARKFVRDNPGAALGIATVAGFMLARLFRGSED